MEFKTEQEKFWAGNFGNQYISRNNSEKSHGAAVAMWSRMLRSANGVRSIRELGCNIGLNLLALKRLNPEILLSGVEINEQAAKQAAALNIANVVNGTILGKIKGDRVDLTFTVGVLIHINPGHLPQVYDNLVAGSNRYVLVAEYYNPSPTTIPYRGHADRLFKRDFAGDLIDSYGLKLIDYGFFYKRDNWAPHDDVTWFLLEK